MLNLKKIKKLSDLKWKGERVFLRLDLNVPIKGEKILDLSRIKAALPSIEYLHANGAQIIIGSHLGRPKNNKEYSLAPVAEALGNLLNKEIILIEDPLSDTAKFLLPSVKKNQIIMLENLRYIPGETKNKPDLQKVLSKYITAYVNDAFGVCHRVHSSVNDVPKHFKKKAVGFLIEKEIQSLDSILYSKKKMLLALGGSKVSDKIALIEAFIDKADTLLIGGAMAYPFLKAQGKEVGESFLEQSCVNTARKILKRFQVKNKNIILPSDHRVVSDIDNLKSLKVVTEIPSSKMAIDIGPATSMAFENALKSMDQVLWNGPFGMFETKEYSKGTMNFAKALSKSTATSFVGGGDSSSAIHQSGFADSIFHVSTGGAAFLEYIEKETLPGLEALI
ncbi:MAG: phosphoglycerate kinase [Bdellovibrionaceae bacterium]|nr:phosphoglycerate kinase [Pseudobdellovibrionaceae bacterium]